MNLSVLYGLLFVRRQPDLHKLPTNLLEEAFIYTSVAYELGGPGVLPDELYENLALELLSRKAQCSPDFHLAVNWDILTMKATNLALDLDSPLCKSAVQVMVNLSTILGG